MKIMLQDPESLWLLWEDLTKAVIKKSPCLYIFSCLTVFYTMQNFA